MTIHLLIQTYVTPNTNLSILSCPYNSITCLSCTHMPHTHQFKSTTNNNRLKLLNNANCSSSNLLYVIRCSLSSLQYVGETGDTAIGWIDIDLISTSIKTLQSLYILTQKNHHAASISWSLLSGSRSLARYLSNN